MRAAVSVNDLIERRPANGALSTVLVADDSPANVALLERLLTRDGYRVLTATNGVDALAIAQHHGVDLVLTDLVMPGLDGHDLCRAIKTSPETRLTPVVLITGSRERDDRLKGIDAGADDFLVKPVDPHELRARVRSLLRLKRYTDELDSAEAVIMSLARTVEARDPCTEGHCQRLSRLGAALGRRIGVDDAAISALTRGGVLHDVGKIGIPDSILLKPSALTAAEFAQMKQHTVIGDGICANLRFLQPVRPIVRHHHERLDGTGYPDGLRGRDVPLLAQIVSVVDVYDALRTDRPYKRGVDVPAALEALFDEAEKGWRDRELVDEFAAMCGEREDV